MPNVRAVLVAVLLGLSLGGCGLVTSEHPLTTDEESVLDRRLIGRWQADPPEGKSGKPVDLLYVGREEDTQKSFEAVWSEIRNEHVHVTRLRFRVAQIGESRYASATGEEEGKGWIVFGYRLPEEDRLQVLILKPDVVAQAIEQGELEGRAKKRTVGRDLDENPYEEVHVTSAPAVFRAWIAAHAPACLEQDKVATFRRVVPPGD